MCVLALKLSVKAEICWFCFVFLFIFTHFRSYAVNSRPGVDGVVDLLCRRLMTQGSRQHRMMAIRMPNSVVISPEKINRNLYCDASAPGFSCTRPTINNMAPISIVTTAMCKTDICTNKSKTQLIKRDNQTIVRIEFSEFAYGYLILVTQVSTKIAISCTVFLYPGKNKSNKKNAKINK